MARTFSDWEGTCLIHYGVKGMRWKYHKPEVEVMLDKNHRRPPKRIYNDKSVLLTEYTGSQPSKKNQPSAKSQEYSDRLNNLRSSSQNVIINGRGSHDAIIDKMPRNIDQLSEEEQDYWLSYADKVEKSQKQLRKRTKKIDTEVKRALNVLKRNNK